MRFVWRKTAALLVSFPLCFYLCGCSPFTPTQSSSAAASRASQEEDIRESFFRSWFKTFGNQRMQVYFIGLNRSDKSFKVPEDLDVKFLKRFSGHRPEVKPASQAVIAENGVVKDRRTKAKGIVFYANNIKWLSNDKVSLEGGYLQSGLAAAHCKHILVRKNAKWIVIQQTGCVVA